MREQIGKPRTKNRVSFRESRANPPFPRAASILPALYLRESCTDSSQRTNITRYLSGKLRRPGDRRCSVVGGACGLRLCGAWLTDVSAADAHWFSRTRVTSTILARLSLAYLEIFFATGCSFGLSMRKRHAFPEHERPYRTALLATQSLKSHTAIP